MKWWNRLRSWTDRVTTSASDVTHRAVAHTNPVETPVMSDEEVLVSVEEGGVSRDAHFARTFWLTGLVAGALALIVWKAFDLLLLIILAYILSVGLEGPIRFFQRVIKSRGFAMFIVYFLLIVFFLSMLMIIPFIAEQLFEMAQVIINTINAISQQIATNGFDVFVQETSYIPGWFKDNVMEMAQNEGFVTSVSNVLDNISQTVNGYVSSGLATDSVTVLRNVFGSSFMTGWKISLVLILSVFFSIEYKEVFVFLVKFAPVEYRPYIYQKMLTIYDKMQLWLKGQVFLMFYIFVVVLIGLWVLGLFGIEIPQIWLLALIAGLTEFLPYIGPILGGLPAVLVAFTGGGWIAAVCVMGMFWFIQWTENNIVVPVVMNRVLGVRSLIIFVTMLIAAWLFGFVGVVMAVPLSVIITTFWSSEDEEAIRGNKKK